MLIDEEKNLLIQIRARCTVLQRSKGKVSIGATISPRIFDFVTSAGVAVARILSFSRI